MSSAQSITESLPRQSAGDRVRSTNDRILVCQSNAYQSTSTRDITGMAIG